ncbi:hypothetical protein L210DRAFT_953985, partial [Boletus edulis BED1]
TADPLSMADVPSIGTKILDRFWPEDEESYSEESCCVSVPSRYLTALAPPPHHRRVPCSLGSIQDVFLFFSSLRGRVVTTLLDCNSL